MTHPEPTTAYVPSEADLRRAGLRSDQHAQPFPTRKFVGEMATGNYLVLVPKPGFKQAVEYNRKGVLVAWHRIAGSFDLLESMAGRGKREATAGA